MGQIYLTEAAGFSGRVWTRGQVKFERVAEGHADA